MEGVRVLQDIIQRIQGYRDSFGLITQKDRDGGDTSQRESAFWVLVRSAYNQPLLNAYPKLELLKAKGYPEGRFIRHPDETIMPPFMRKRWYSNPKNFTADQSINVQSMLISYQCSDLMRALFKERAKRLFFHFNEESYDDGEPIRTKIPDPVRPIEFAQFVRGSRISILKPLLWLLDIPLIISAYARDKESNGDSEQKFMITLESSLHETPTFWGKWAAKVFYSNEDNLKRIRNYHSEENGRNGIEPLGELFEYVFRSRQ